MRFDFKDEAAGQEDVEIPSLQAHIQMIVRRWMRK